MTFVELLDHRGRVLARHRVDHWPITIGRGYDNDVIVDDPYVCPAHLRVSCDGAGLLVVEDLGSVNGTRADADGRVISRAAVPADTRLRIGRSVLRFRRGDAPVPPTLARRSRRAGIDLLTRTPVAVASLFLIVPVVLYSTFVLSYDRPGLPALAGFAIFLVLGLAAWAGTWALVTRVVAHEWRFLAHAAVACAYMVIDLAADAVQSYVAFLGAGTWPGTLLGAACDVLPIAWLLNAHLSIVATMSRRRSAAAAAVVALGLVALVGLASRWSQQAFSNVIHFDSTLEPLPRAWIPGEPIDALVADIGDLESEVRRLAAERPRGNVWSALTELDGR